MPIKHSTLAMTALLVASFSASFAVAQTAAPKAPEPNYTLSYNLGIVSDYRYRGISQSRLKPATQGGIDYANKNGLYLGAWASTIAWIKDTGAVQTPAVDAGTSPLEIDLYGGYKFEASKGVTFDVGALQYMYPGNKLQNVAGASNANTLELYGAVTLGMVTAKYSRSQGNLFGTGLTTGATSTKGSGYFDLSATFDLSNGYTIVPHFGSQTVANTPNSSYTDYSVMLNKDIDGLVLSGGVVGTRTKNNGAYLATAPISNKNLGKGALVFSVKKNF
jgi:uncharacterized protein (TIGR02001 family)